MFVEKKTASVAEDFKYKKKGETLEVKKLEKFNHYVHIVRKHNIFNRSDKFYNTLDLLTKIRNRVHIQNRLNLLEADEDKVFTEKTLEIAERVLEIILISMISTYPRRIPEIDLKEFPFPWPMHYKS